MSTDQEIHRELASLGPAITELLQDIDPEATPLEIWQSISTKEKTKFLKMAQAKNARVWELVAASWVSNSIYESAKELSATYRVALPAKTTLLLSDYVKEYFVAHGLEFVKQTSATDVSKLKAWVWGQSRYADVPLLEQPNLSYIVDGGYARAARIKAVEMHRATNAGGQGFMGDAGFSSNEWFTMGDRRVRPSHRGNSGIVVLIGEPFPNGEHYPGESSIGCRCHLSYGNDEPTQGAKKKYASNVKAYESELADEKKNKIARKVAPDKPVGLTIKGSKPEIGEVIPRKVAPFEQPKLIIAKEEHRAMAEQSLKNYNAMPDELKRNVKEILISPNAWREDAALSEKYGRKVFTEAVYDKKNARLMGFPDMNGASRPISKKFMAHELAHGIDDGISGKAAWLSNVKKDGNFASKYAEDYFNKEKKNYSEDFAESMRRYVTEKDKFVKECPNRAEYLERVVLSGKYRAAKEARKK